MEFREISTFLQVAQHQSFSKAAKQLGYSQAAVTIQIKQLEGELGVHLFDRIGKQISLTHQGTITSDSMPVYFSSTSSRVWNPISCAFRIYSLSFFIFSSGEPPAGQMIFPGQF